MRQVVLDTETTGMRVEDGNRIIEIGCIEMINRRITNKHFHVYLNPDRDVEAGAQAVHGITAEFLKDKPRFAEIVDELMAFVSGAELIIHNAPFDLAYIHAEFALTKRAWKDMSAYCAIIDTLQMARRMHAGQRNNLDALCKRYGVDHSKREHHGALLDADLLAQVYLAMTGGQSSFFDTTETTTTTVTQSAQTVLSSGRQALFVLKADQAELAEHDRYLELLKKKGQCVWE